MAKLNASLNLLVVLTLMILYCPIIVAIVFSFNAADRGMLWEGFSLRWYSEVWTERGLLDSLANSIIVTGIACAISLAMGLACSFALSLVGGRLFGILLALVFLPILTPDLLASLSQALFYQSIGWDKNLLTIALSYSTFGLSYVALFVTARLRTLDFSSYRRAASALGASTGLIFRTIFLPLARPPAFAATILVASLFLQDFIFAFFCGGLGSTTLSVRLYGMIKFGLRPSVNVIYTLLVLSAIGMLMAAEIIARRVKNENR